MALPTLCRRAFAPMVGISARMSSSESAAQTKKSFNRGGGRSKGETYVEIPVETSLKYMKSEAYATNYGNDPVWKHYRRNFKGTFAPEPRKTCVRAEAIATNSPCPICRDENLLLHHQNVKLLEQFIDPYSGETLGNITYIRYSSMNGTTRDYACSTCKAKASSRSYTSSERKTGLCRKKQDKLHVEVHKAKALGLIEFDVPFRSYDYSEYTSSN